ATPAAGSDSYLSSREDIQAIPPVFPRISEFFANRPGKAPWWLHHSAQRLDRAPGAAAASHATQLLLPQESAANGATVGFVLLMPLQVGTARRGAARLRDGRGGRRYNGRRRALLPARSRGAPVPQWRSAWSLPRAPVAG